MNNNDNNIKKLQDYLDNYIDNLFVNIEAIIDPYLKILV